ncbi:MAG: MoxR family ATPase [Planctomycetota bacterium]|nr:MoxR family ATPase [Planctomycetota bacterium]
MAVQDIDATQAASNALKPAVVEDLPGADLADALPPPVRGVSQRLSSARDGFNQAETAATMLSHPTVAAESADDDAGAKSSTRELFDRITSEIRKIYVGQEELVLGSLVALFSGGHVLVESVPGMGKTLFVRTLGRVLGCNFGRIQFNADLMPSDVTGAPVFNMKTQEFYFRAGPVFTQLLLADEINRAPAKTHAALLEIMEECRVTVDGKSHEIERPFLVMATENPVESEGTYNLPEAQLDRFMLKLLLNYPEESQEADILKLHSLQTDMNQRLREEVNVVTSPDEILKITQENSAIRVDDKLIDYVNKIVRLTRRWPQFHMGASPRAGLALVQSSRTLAAFRGRDYAVPDDVVQLALPALRHRVVLTAEAEVEGHDVDALLSELIRSVEVPRI